MGAAVDTTLGLTIDREPPRGLIDLPLRQQSMRRHDVARSVVTVLCSALAAGVLVLFVREVLRWVGA